MTFTALVVDKAPDGTITQTVRELDDALLPEGEVTLHVDFSTLNYKDGLCMWGQGGLVRTYPHVPGVDLSGVVETSDDPRYQPGDRVVLTGGAAVPSFTVIPFILRGVNLLGIDSVMRPHADRLEAWDRIVTDLPMDGLDAMVSEHGLAEMPALGRSILEGGVKGRVVVDPRR